MSLEMQKIDESKRELRRRLAALPFAEKLRILDELRERTLALRRNPLRRKPSQPLPPASAPGITS